MNRYDRVAEWYDLYVQTDVDLPYFRRLAEKARRILDLMAGTGRVSMALAEATRGSVVSIDASWPMLRPLTGKSAASRARVCAVGADVGHLPLRTGFDLVVIPFNSIAEVVSAESRRRVIREVWRVIAPDGRFVCTLHNPDVRARTLDGVCRVMGPFELSDGTRLRLEVTGTIDRSTRLATSVQRFTRESSAGAVLELREQIVSFALITRDELEREALACGFEIEALHGDYEEAAFDAERSPFMIWRFRRPPGTAV